MTTVSQVKQVARPLLERNPDLALVGRLVVIKPVHHILRGILIDFGRHPKLFVPTWAAVPLFEPNAHFHFFWGTGIGGLWKLGTPDLAGKMADALEREALPVLRPIITIDDFVRFTNGTLIEDHKSYVDAALGDLPAARSMCDFFAGLNGRFGVRHEEFELIVRELCPRIAADDRRGLARLLHRYEAESVKRLKLEKLWEPTPFPIEMQS